MAFRFLDDNEAKVSSPPVVKPTMAGSSVAGAPRDETPVDRGSTFKFLSDDQGVRPTAEDLDELQKAGHKFSNEDLQTVYEAEQSAPFAGKVWKGVKEGVSGIVMPFVKAPGEIKQDPSAQRLLSSAGEGITGAAAGTVSLAAKPFKFLARKVSDSFGITPEEEFQRWKLNYLSTHDVGEQALPSSIMKAWTEFKTGEPVSEEQMVQPYPNVSSAIGTVASLPMFEAGAAATGLNRLIAAPSLNISGRLLGTGGKALEKAGQTFKWVGERPEAISEAVTKRVLGEELGHRVGQVVDVGELPAAGAAAILGHPAVAGVIAGAKTLEKAGPVVKNIGLYAQRLAEADPASPFGRLYSVAKDTTAPEWMRALSDHWLTKAPAAVADVMGTGIKASATGALFGAGLSALSGDDAETLGQNIGGGATFGALTAAMGAPGLRKARILQKSLEDLSQFYQSHLSDGVTPEALKKVGTDAMTWGATMERVFGDGTKIRFAGTEEGSPLPADVRGQAGAWKPESKTLWVNVDAKRDPGATVLHEILHPIFDGEVINRPEVKSQIDAALQSSGRSLYSAKVRYMMSLLKGQFEAAKDPQAKRALLDQAIQSKDLASQASIGDPDAWIYSEILSEAGARSLYGQHPILDVIDPSITATALDSVKGFLQKLGVSFKEKAATGIKPATVLPGFENVIDSPVLRKTVYSLIRAQKEYLPGVTPATGQGVKITKEMWGQHPGASLETRADGTTGNDFVTVTSDGRVVERPKREVKKIVKNRRKEVNALYPLGGTPLPASDQTPGIAVRNTPSGLTERSGTHLGPGFDSLTSFGDKTKSNAHLLEQAIAEGKPTSGWYQQIGVEGKGGEWKESVAKDTGAIEAQYKDFFPIGFLVDKQANLLVRNYSLTAFDRKAAEWASRHGPVSLELWNGDAGHFKNDVAVYLQNHAANLPGEANNLGVDKKNVINAFLVGGNRTFEVKNPLRPSLKGADRQGVVRSYRLDRLETLEPGQSTLTQPEYHKQVLNLSPAQSHQFDEGTGLTAKGWILPNSQFVPMTGEVHSQFLVDQASALKKKFGVDFSKYPAEDSDAGPRIPALNKGFIRTNYERNTGTLTIEANIKHWTKANQDTVLSLVADNLGKIDNVRIALLDNKANVKKYDSSQLFQYEGQEKLNHIPFVSEESSGRKFSPDVEELDRTQIKGGSVSVPATSYGHATALADTGNPWVRRSADPLNNSAPTNEKRTLLVQFSSDFLTKGLGELDYASTYYDALYSGARSGYARMEDFWEIPQWIGFASHIFPDADVYVVRDMPTAKQFLNEAAYGRVAFSALDVNKAHIAELAKEYPGHVDVGGYVDPTFFKDLPNVKWHDTLESMARDAEVEYRQGVDFRHFQGADVIPRLTMSTGCKHKCAFCTIEKQVKTTPDTVVKQQADAIAKLGTKLIYINDKTFGQAPNYESLSDLTSAVKKQNPNFEGFVVQTTASQMTKFKPEWLKKSGIKFVELGIETYNDPILHAMKKPATESLMDRATQSLRDNKIALIPNIIIGLPGETAESYARTLDFLKKNADIISHANIYNLALYENTELGKSLTTATPDDFNENVLEKSFHADPRVHQVFAGDVYGIGKEFLSKHHPEGLFSPDVKEETPQELPKIRDMQTLFAAPEDKRRSIQIEGPDGKKYAARFDGYQDFTSLGMGKLPQITAMEDIPGVTKAKSTTYGPTLTKAGFKLPDLTHMSPDVEQHAKTIVEDTLKNGGVTFNTHAGKSVGQSPVYGVSLYPERSAILDPAELTPERVAQFIDTNSDLLQHKENSVGTWFDKASGKVYLDVSLTVPDRDFAKFAGDRANQKAIWDSAKSEEIPLKGTGAPVVDLPLAPQRLEVLKKEWEKRQHELHSEDLLQADGTYSPATDTNKEHIVQAAIQFSDGKIFTGSAHFYAFEAAEKAGQTWDTQYGSNVVDGFVTSKGRFVDRDEAKKLAMSAGQINITKAREFDKQYEVPKDFKTASSLTPLEAHAFEMTKNFSPDTAFKEAKEYFGVTKNIREAGYVLPDGTMLDFSGRHKSSNAPPDQRVVEHREVYRLPTFQASKAQQRAERMSALEANNDFDVFNDAKHPMDDFMEMGAMRMDASGGLAELSSKPTFAQLQTLKRIGEDYGGSIHVDAHDGKRDASFFGEPKRVAGKLRRFYSGEEFPPLSEVYSPDVDKKVERVERAALRLKTGQVYTGLLHGDAAQAAIDDGHAPIDVMPGTVGVDEGFTTSKGRFLSREQAFALAVKNHQLANPMDASASRGVGENGEEGLEAYSFKNNRKFSPDTAEMFSKQEVNPMGERPENVKDESLLYPDKEMTPTELAASNLARKELRDRVQILPNTDDKVKLRRALNRGFAEVSQILDTQSKDAGFDSGADWYRKDMESMEKTTQQIFPEAKDPAKMVVFKAIMASLSPSAKPTENYRSAAESFAQYLKTGKFPATTPYRVTETGKRKKLGVTAEPAAEKLNALLKQTGGEKQLVEYLLTKHDETLYGNKDAYGALDLGPKVGRFFLNLNGHADEVTVDLWATRTFNRWMGTPFREQAGKTVLPDMPTEQERNLMIQAFNEIGAKISAETGTKLSAMDVQAVLWYYEKDLYSNLSETGRSSFSEAAKTYAEDPLHAGPRRVIPQLPKRGAPPANQPELPKAKKRQFVAGPF